MESTEQAIAPNQSIERGIFLTPFDKLFHACKVREDIGAGITRCGFTFLIGHGCYRHKAVYGAPPQEGSDSLYSRCPKCDAATDYKAVSARWNTFKKVVNKTLRLIGHFKPTAVGSLPSVSA